MTRGLSFRAAALLGLSEGEFPQAEHEAVLLRETDRAVLRERGLSIEPKLRGDEVTILYQAVTRATDRLLLTRPYLAPDGQPWEPSPYWAQVTQLIDQPIVRKVCPEDALDPAEAASPIEFMQAARQFDNHVQHSIEVLRALVSSCQRGWPLRRYIATTFRGFATTLRARFSLFRLKAAVPVIARQSHSAGDIQRRVGESSANRREYFDSC